MDLKGIFSTSTSSLMGLTKKLTGKSEQVSDQELVKNFLNELPTDSKVGIRAIPLGEGTLAIVTSGDIDKLADVKTSAKTDLYFRTVSTDNTGRQKAELQTISVKELLSYLSNPEQQASIRSQNLDPDALLKSYKDIQNLNAIPKETYPIQEESRLLPLPINPKYAVPALLLDEYVEEPHTGEFVQVQEVHRENIMDNIKKQLSPEAQAKLYPVSDWEEIPASTSQKIVPPPSRSSLATSSDPGEIILGD